MLELFNQLTSTLYGKTYAILSLQLAITWLSTIGCVWALHKHHAGRARDVSGLEDRDYIDEAVLGAVLA